MFEMQSHSRVLQQKIKVKQHSSVCIGFSVADSTHNVRRVEPNSSVWRPIPPCGAQFLRVAPNSSEVTGDNSPVAATNDQYGSGDRDPAGDFHRVRASGAVHRCMDRLRSVGRLREVAVSISQPRVGGRHLALLKIASVRPPSCVIGPRWQIITFDDNARNPV